jgi:hypothetical protein
VSNRVHSVVRTSEGYAFCSVCQKSVVGKNIVWAGSKPYCSNHVPKAEDA